MPSFCQNKLHTTQRFITMRLLLLCLFTLLVSGLSAQLVVINGTVSDAETSKRIDRARIRILIDGEIVSNYIMTGRNGNYEVKLPGPGEYTLSVQRGGYQEQLVALEVEEGVSALNVNIPLEAFPGYDFDFTMRERLKSGPQVMGDTISGVRIEIYDVTAGREIQDSTLIEASQGFTLARGHRYAFLLRKDGYFAKRFDVLVDVEGCILCFEGLGSAFEPNILESLSGGGQGPGAVLADIGMRPIVVGEEVEIPNIYYDYDKAAIRADARPILTRLAAQLRATPVEVILGSHTDARGSAEYNQKLSQRRAESAVRYLESRGVAEGRITATGFGESRLTNACEDGVECTEEQHQENRRTTFTVTKLLQRSTFENRTLQDLMDQERESNRRETEIIKVEPAGGND